MANATTPHKGMFVAMYDSEASSTAASSKVSIILGGLAALLNKPPVRVKGNVVFETTMSTATPGNIACVIGGSKLKMQLLLGLEIHRSAFRFDFASCKSNNDDFLVFMS